MIHAQIKNELVRDLCPNIVTSEKKMRIQDLLAFLEAPHKEVRIHNNKYICTFGKNQVSFDEEPTVELLQKYENMPEDYSRHVAAVEDLLKDIKNQSEKTNPFRQVRCYRVKAVVTEQPDILVNGIYVKQPSKISHQVDYHEHPPCKNCGGRDYIDCNTHYTCKKCAVVMDKIHTGLAYREMRDRKTDMNGRSMAINTLYSESFHRLTDIVSNNTKDKKFSKREFQKLQISNEKMKICKEDAQSKRDRQVFAARVKIKKVCSALRLCDGVVRKAHILYCKHRKNVGVLRNNGAVIAACIFYALPPMSKKYNKVKRKSTSWSDTKQKRLKLINFKKPLNITKRRYSLVSKLQQKKAI